MKFLGLAFLAGLVGALGFQPLALWPLTILAFAALLWLVEQAPSLRSALARGWWFGFGQFVLGLNWIATAFTYPGGDAGLARLGRGRAAVALSRRLSGRRGRPRLALGRGASR